MKNPIKSRSYYAVKLMLASPAAVSSGEDYYSDADVLRNGNGEVFIPGTSVAGALRNYLHNNKDYEKLFGYSGQKEGLMSAVYISDLYFEEKKKPEVSLRDRVKLLDNKTVENKFDQEIIETGAVGVLYLEYVIRKEQEGVAWDELIALLLRGMQSGEIRFGSDKNRGFGRVRILDVYEKKFDAGDADSWLAFQRLPKEELKKYHHLTYQEWEKDNPGASNQYVHIAVPLKQKGGISIRTYSTEPGKADYKHITCNGKPVIPGSSWNGAIRWDAKRILEEAGVKNADQVICAWFGCIKQEGQKKAQQKEEAWQSKVVVGESILSDGSMLPMTRNKISRFDSSTVNGALYSEISYVDGRTKLELMVKKDDFEKYKAVAGLLYLVIRDIQKGYLAVGGQTAVGRGIFKADGKVICSEALPEEECLRALYREVNRK